MLCKSLVILATASRALAATPGNFKPAAQTSLIVSFSNVAANDGNVLAKDATQTAPTIGTQSQLDGKSYAVLMIDLDIPTDNPPKTNTLLHWMQTGLTSSTTATAINSTAGSTNAFKLTAAGGQAAFAEYLGPSPPAKVPLSHRYTQILVDTSAATTANLAVLQKAAATRMGFDTNAVLTEAGLVDKVIAGNFFNVTNPGPAAAATNSTTGTTNGTAGATGSGSTATRSPSSPSSSPIVPASAATQRASEMLLGIGVVGAVFFTL
ncbi:PEBP-like protein [Whalleya microplaca]|nr:PEBP-like protein [Whalleya microplaca]